MRNRTLRIGSRGSELALWQAGWVRDQLMSLYPDLEVSVKVIKTTGERLLETLPSRTGNKGMFTKEIEEELIADEIDIAVHSLKDLPTELPDGLTIGAITGREDVRDVFIPHPSNVKKTLVEQPDNATIATGSLRRKCQLLYWFPGFEVVGLRGNLNTRFRKLDESSWSGIVLARAGVARLGWMNRVGETIDIATILPAVGQGALCIEIRSDDVSTLRFVKSLNDEDTVAGVNAERALLKRLEGGCQVPVGAYGRIEQRANGEPSLVLDGMVGSLDGKVAFRDHVEGKPAEAEELGISLAENLLNMGAKRILEDIRREGRVMDGVSDGGP